ncbi:tetratricopeptide repeat protein [Streptomyces ureilyticus]|uniref:Tetratricopeptide repeat protein n=1 Tax=Streptomyces ureilyticus TaxID=1775131 RepID=A0ABX0DZ40_9ACTN|nr:tetratricopeptide repeat protein [Streptomyces ureilyticus]NGO46627.1 tetratricopeptide repeat protein [Streptomyces ureilyticus]
MAGRGPSRQELIRRRRQSGFVGRQGELAAFRDTLRQAPEEAAQFLFHIHGPAGVGKSTLVRQMEGAAREQQGITAYVDESAADVVEAMEAISTQFAQQGLALKSFDKLLATYRQRRHEADSGAAGAGAATESMAGAADGVVTGPVPPASSPASVVASQVGLVGLGMIPGVGAFAGAVDPNQVAAGADRLKALLSARFRSHDDVQIVLSPLKVLTPAFLQDLAEVAQRRPWVVLFFDTYERIGPLLDIWLRDVLVSDLYGELPANVLVVLAGQSRLETRCWADHLDLVTSLPLEVFTEAEAHQLLAAKGITDKRRAEVILQLSGRLPVLVSTLAEARPTSVEEIGDPSGTAVERFLKWETDPARRAAALACALPQEVDEDIYRAAVDEAAAELFGWLRTLPFVTDRASRCRYHDVVRTAMLRLQRRQSPSQWSQQHTSLADTFQGWRLRLEEHTPPKDGWWDDERWRDYRRQETYHRLCADPHAALPDALRECLDAYDHGIATLRRWAQTLDRAGHDGSAIPVSSWGRQLLTALEEQNQPGVTVLTHLLTRGQLDAQGRAFALVLRGRDHRNADRNEQALADYNLALTLDPEAARAAYGRGVTYYDLDRYDDALADFNRAIELNPDDALAIAVRGVTYSLMDRHDDALADLNHAIELNPDHAWTITSRGRTYYEVDRYDDALADFNRALELNPDYTWAITIRGQANRFTGRYDDALADFNRAIELNPDHAWTIAARGMTYYDVDRYDDALADFNRAIELNPDYAQALAARGATNRLMYRYDDALADLNRAIELNPDYAWAIAIRGAAYYGVDHYDDALADFNRALELNPDYAWAIAIRGAAYYGVDHYDDALADLNRAIELNPRNGWAHYKKALVLHSMAHPDQTLCLTRAIELFTHDAADPSPQKALNGKGNLVTAYCAIQRWDDAGRYLADFISSGPIRGQIKAVLADLDELVQAIASAEEHVSPLLRRLENALAAAP